MRQFVASDLHDYRKQDIIVFQVENEMNRKTKIVIAIAIVFALVAGAGLSYWLHARSISYRQTCLNNLRMIDGVQTCCIPLSQNLYFGDRMDPEVCFKQFLSKRPVCPAGGQYIISWIVGGPYPKCTVHGDLLQETSGNRTFEGIGERPKDINRDPKARQPLVHSQGRTYDPDVSPGLPDLGPLRRIATSAIGTITSSNPDLKGHKLELYSVRYSHRFLASAESPVGIMYEAIYCDSKLSQGNATGIDLDVRDNVVQIKSSKGIILASYPLDGPIKVPEDLVRSIASRAILFFWPQINTNRLSLEEIICCDPIHGNDYTVNFRLDDSASAETPPKTAYTFIEVSVRTDGLVKEDKIIWRSKPDSADPPDGSPAPAVTP